MINFAENLNKMRKLYNVAICFAMTALVVSCACKDKNKNQDKTNVAEPTVAQEEKAVPDSTVWGHLGEGTSMNILEFITDNGEVLMVRRDSEETGEMGQMLGTLRDGLTDRFAMTINNRNDEESMYINTCINVTELMGVWRNGENVLSLYSDSTASNEAAHYTAWKIYNGKLILSGKTSTEYGEIDRMDTMTISYLDEDSLKFITPQHEEIAFGKKPMQK